MKVTEFGKEFKAFALKGNLIDLAVAVVIGGAFGAVVNSLVKNVFMPLISYLPLGGEGYRSWMIGKIEIGVFLGEVINFVIVALAVFIVIVKVLGSLTKKEPGPPTTKECGKCCSEIPIKATRCKFCTSEVAAK